VTESPNIELAVPGTQPDYYYPPYVSSMARSPRMPLVPLSATLTELTGPRFGHSLMRDSDNDLTSQHAGDPLGERIYVHGRVLDEDGRPIRNALVEIWQANAAGRYRHKVDTWDAPLDPNFTGSGKALTDEHGSYCFKTIKPGPYPWKNPLQALDPIFNSIPDEAARLRLVSTLDMPRSEPNYALAFAFDIVLRGRGETPFEVKHR